MFSRRAASEFPNDNPELHDGLVWQSDSVTGHALPTLRLRPLAGRLPKVLGPTWIEAPRRAAPAPEAERRPVVDSAPEPVLAEDEHEHEHEHEHEQGAEVAADSTSVPVASPFDALVAALVRVALDRGATRVAAELPALLSGGRAAASVGDTARARALVALGPAWRAVLEGTTSDLAGCGDQPLDVWAAELLSTVLAAPSEREALRRALRRHGVAAFGMLVAA